MNGHDGFINAILSGPGDPSLLLVYADWLEERGDVRAEYLRLRVRLAELPAGDPDRVAVESRLGELLPHCPEEWLASLEGPRWALVGNIIAERSFGPGGAEKRPGTKHFSPGTKVYCVCDFPGDGHERISAIGRHRGSKRFVAMVIRSAWVTNWRAKLVYEPPVLARLRRYPGYLFTSREHVEEHVTMFRDREQQPQPEPGNEPTDSTPPV